MFKNKGRVYIVNDTRDCGVEYGPTFAQFGEITKDLSTLKLQPQTFNLVVFTGGADITPEIYGDTSPNGICHNNMERDAEEIRIYRFAKAAGIKMVGICRGMQFLNVMTGGGMIHDLSGHTGGNHQVMTKSEDDPFITNSFHHQMCIPNVKTHILGWSHQKLSKRYIGDKDEPVSYKGPEVEAIYATLPLDGGVVGVQWHPECMPESDKGRTWFMFLVKDLLNFSEQHFKKLYLGVEGSRLNERSIT